VYYYSSGSVQDDRSAVRASQMYATALGYMNSGDNSNAAYYIGAMAHYISDVGVFGHTMGISTDWGAETHHSDYENGIESMIGSLGSPTGVSLGNMDAYGATIGLAYEITFGGGIIMSNVLMDTNYDWTDPVFVAGATSSLNSSVAAVAAAVNHLLVEATPQPPPPHVPQPPSSLKASLVDSRVVLTWSPPANDGGATVTGYTILRTTDSDDNIVTHTVPASSQTWVDESVERGKTYGYWVLAENSVGLSDKSLSASVTIPGGPNSSGWLITISAILTVALASGTAILWRRMSRGKILP